MTTLVDPSSFTPSPPALRTSKRKRSVVKYYNSESSDEEAEDSLDELAQGDVLPVIKVL